MGVSLIGMLVYSTLSAESTRIETPMDLERHTARVIDMGRTKSAVQYNDFIIGLEVRVAQRLTALDDRGTPEQQAVKRAQSHVEIASTMDALDTVVPFEGGQDFRHAAREKFVLQAERIRLLEATEKHPNPGGALSDLLLLRTRIQRADQAFRDAQRAFAKDHGVTLRTNVYAESVPAAQPAVDTLR